MNGNEYLKSTQYQIFGRHNVQGANYENLFKYLHHIHYRFIAPLTFIQRIDEMYKEKEKRTEK